MQLRWVQQSSVQAGSGFISFPAKKHACTSVHVQSPDGEAKFWLDPVIALAQHTGLSRREISEAQRLVQKYENDIRDAWFRHFGS
jgi:hypothetical protein